MKKFLLYILSVVAIFLFTIFIYLFIGFLQGVLFVPGDVFLWVFKYPASQLVLVYEVFLFLALFYVMFGLKWQWKKWMPAFVGFNIVLFYYILTSVTVITDDRIVDHSFFAPQGKEYAYSDVVKVETGVYGENKFMRHSKGDFFYKIQLHDGTVIDLAEVGGVRDDEHEFFVIEELDQEFVELGVVRVASMENFDYLASYYDSIYSESVRRILEKK